MALRPFEKLFNFHTVTIAPKIVDNCTVTPKIVASVVIYKIELCNTVGATV